MKSEPRSYSRLGLVETFLEIAVDSYIEFKQDKRILDQIVSEGGIMHEGFMIYNRETDHQEYNNKLRKDTIKVIVFLTTFLESYINDLGGIVLGDTFVKEHLDKLSLISKWIVIPRLITNEEIDKSKSYYQGLKELVQWRNNLIHHKTRNAITFFKSPDTKNLEKLKPIYELFDVSKCFNMIKELFDELNRIDPQGSHTLRIKRVINRINE
jgi:hypothetical protein